MRLSLRSVILTIIFLAAVPCSNAATLTPPPWSNTEVRAQGAGTGAMAPAFQVDVAASLYSLDRFGYPDAISFFPGQPARTSPRAFGLEASSIVINANLGQSSALQLTLRPDAVNRGTTSGSEEQIMVTREVDTRAGEVYRRKPSLRLLDSYQLVLRPGTRLIASAGVYEQIMAIGTAYNSVLEFGLNVQLPAKFSGALLRWSDQAEGPQPVAINQHFSVAAHMLQGHDDRAEAMGRPRGRFDTGPVAQDPYQAGAVSLTYQPNRLFGIFFLGGFGDNAELRGRRSEQFGELAAVVRSQIGDHSWTVSLDARTTQEQWRSQEYKVAPRSQQSLALQAAFGLLSEHWLLLGVHAGKSERPLNTVTLDATKAYTGWQLDLGYRQELERGLSLEFYGCEEHRERKDATGKTSGGFPADDGEDRRTLRRMGMRLAFALGGSI